MTNLPLATQIVIALAAGFSIGAALYATLYWNGCLFARGHWLAALPMQLLRFALAAVTLVALAHGGATLLIAAFAGILIARTWLVRRVLRTLA
ncbi:MAG: N-ATPase subunit AtpR [Trinickia sp.]|jgi:F1F0 ATPase subunit 2